MASIPVVLVCDDDPDDRTLIKEAFSAAEINAAVRFADDGSDLVHYMESCKGNQESPCPAVILLDLNMPKMDGKQALKWIKSHSEFRTVPVVIFTTSSEKSDIRECYQLGANTFMTKCVDFESLVDMACTFSKYWMDIAKLP